MRVSADGHRSQKGLSHLLELGVQIVVNHLTWVLERELGSSTRAVEHQAISLAL